MFDKRKLEELTDDEEVIGTLCRLSAPPMTSAVVLEREKKMRREIANSNERRRMQSINAGFNALKGLLPRSNEGEKLSKAAILQQTADYVCQLEKEKRKLVTQIGHLQKMVNNRQSSNSDGEASASETECPIDERMINSGTPTESLRPMISELPPKEESSKNLMERFDDVRDLKRKMKHDDYPRAYDDHRRAPYSGRPAKLLKTYNIPRSIDVKDEQLTPAQTPEHTVEFKDDQIDLEKGKLLQKSPIYVTSPSSVAFEHAMPSSTLVTVLSPKEENGLKAEILEVNRDNTSAVTSSDSSEYMAEGPMLYLVNNNNNNNTSYNNKSLNAICEAIRHLEGDTMFPANDHSRLEEVEEGVMEHEEQQPRDYTDNYPRYRHQLNGSVGHLNLEEIGPQDAPLELTTPRAPAILSAQESIVVPRQLSSFNNSMNRPGVIVGKQA